MKKKNINDRREEISKRPEPFSETTVRELWTDEYTSSKMLNFHIDPNSEQASRKHEFIDRSAGWMIKRFELGRGKSVIDLGCGPGLYTERLAKSDAEITGVDFSNKSIRHAKRSATSQGLKIKYIEDDYLHLSIEKQFDLVSLIYCDYCALSPEQRIQLLGVVRGLLKPGGSFFLDVHSYSHYDQFQEGTHNENNDPGNFWSASSNSVSKNSYKYEAEHVTLDKYTIIETSRTRVIYNWLAHFTPETIRAEFEAGGLAVTDVQGNAAGDVYNPLATEFAVTAIPI